MSAYDIIEEQVVPNTAPDEWIKQKCELRKEKNYLLEILPQLEGEQKDTDIEKYLPWSEELPDLNTRHFFIEPFLYSSNIISYLKIKLQKNNLFVKIST